MTRGRATCARGRCWAGSDVKPFWDGSDPYMTGNIAVWTAAREQAVDEALPKIIERLRPKYGRMYNFDDAQPGNVRLVAMDIHPTMSNR